MANATDNIVGGFKDIFLAGVGALALGAEKSKELVDQLISKGEITVEQGKELNEELQHKVADTAVDVHEDLIAAHLSTMTPDQRKAFAAKVAEMANRDDLDAIDPSDIVDGREEEARVVAGMEKTEK